MAKPRTTSVPNKTPQQQTSKPVTKVGANKKSVWKQYFTQSNAALILAIVAVSLTFSTDLFPFSSSSTAGSTPPYEGIRPSTISFLSALESVPLYLSTHTPSEVADALASLSVELYDFAQANEDLMEPSAIRADGQVQRLVEVTRALQQHATKLLRPPLDPTRPQVAYWKVMSALLFSEAVAFADYYQVLDDEPLQAASLLNATNTILYVTKERRVLSHLMDLSDESALRNALVVPHGSESYRQFVLASCMSVASLHRRRAATFELLVVLNPDYAPLRLWYALGLVMDMQRGNEVPTLEFLAREHGIAVGTVKQSQVVRLGVSLHYAQIMYFLQAYGQIRSKRVIEDSKVRMSILEAVRDLALIWTPVDGDAQNCPVRIAESVGITDNLWEKKFGWLGEVHAAPPSPSLLLTASDLEQMSGALIGAMVSWQEQRKIVEEVLRVLQKSCFSTASLR